MERNICVHTCHKQTSYELCCVFLVASHSVVLPCSEGGQVTVMEQQLLSEPVEDEGKKPSNLLGMAM